MTPGFKPTNEPLTMGCAADRAPAGKSRSSALLAVVVLVTLLTHLPALDNGFTNWDDAVYVTANPAIGDSSPAGIGQLLRSSSLGNYQPLTMLLYTVQYRLFSDDPRAFHATNLTVHLLNTALVFGVIGQLGGTAIASFAGALLFGIHPLQVESVAWVSELNNLISALFLLLALASYLRFMGAAPGERRRWYLAALLAYGFSLLAKGTGVAFPLVLVLVAGLRRQKFDRGALRALTPFFLLALLFGFINLRTQQLAGATAVTGGYSLFRALAVAGYAVGWYLLKLLIPVKLSALYPYPFTAGAALPIRIVLALPVALAGVVGAVLARRRQSVLAFGFLFFLAALAPALKIIPLGYAFAADRYVYFPAVGLFFVAGITIARWWGKAASGRRVGAVLLAFLLVGGAVVLSLTTRRRILVWHDSVSLWSDVLKNYPEAPVAWANRAAAYAALGDNRRALSDVDRAFALAPPTTARAYLLRSRLRRALGFFPEAREDLARAAAMGALPDRALPGPGQ